MGLDELKKGKRAKIKTIADQYAHKKRLYAMGFLPGEEIELVRGAPLGGPIVVQIMGYEICLRRDCAANIRIQQIESINE